MSIGITKPALISSPRLCRPQRTRRRAGRGLVLCLRGVTHSPGVQTSRGSGQRSTIALLPNVPALGKAGPQSTPQWCHTIPWDTPDIPDTEKGAWGAWLKFEAHGPDRYEGERRI